MVAGHLASVLWDSLGGAYGGRVIGMCTDTNFALESTVYERNLGEVQDCYSTYNCSHGCMDMDTHYSYC